MINTIIVSIIGTAITLFLIYAIARMIHGRGFSDYLLKNDLFISLCIVFASIYLLFFIGALLGKQYYEIKVLGGISVLAVVVFYLLGIYTAIKLLARKIGTRGRRLYYLTTGIFIFALWMFMIFVVRLTVP